MGAVFLILLILAVPNMAFFYHGQTGGISNFNSAITSLSIGNIEAAKPACAIGPFNMTQPIPEKGLIDREVSLVLSCPIGKLNELSDVGQVPSS